MSTACERGRPFVLNSGGDMRTTVTNTVVVESCVLVLTWSVLLKSGGFREFSRTIN